MEQLTLISIYKHYAIDITDPRSMQDVCHMNFAVDFAHCGVSVAQWLEHRSAESEGLRFDSSEFFLCPCSWQDEKTFSGANGLIVTDPCGSNSSAVSEMTAFDGRIVHNRINGFTICHGIFRTGFVRTPLPEFRGGASSHYAMHEVRFFQLKIQSI